MARHRELHGEIDWSTAIVEGARVSVRFAGDPASSWAERVAEVLDRLQRPGSDWGKIKVKRRRIRVDAVQAGAEADLRLLIESAVRQANADLAQAEGDDAGERSQADDAMAEVFRSFGEPASAGGDAPA